MGLDRIGILVGVRISVLPYPCLYKAQLPVRCKNCGVFRMITRIMSAMRRQVVSLVLLGLGVALAVGAQAILVYLPDGLTLSQNVAGALQPIWPHPAQVVFALGLFLLAMICFVAAVKTDSAEVVWPSCDVRPPRLATLAWTTMLLAASGLIVLACVSFKLATADYDPAYPRWYALAIVLLLGSLSWNERLWLVRMAKLWLKAARGHVLEAMYIVFMVGLFLWLSISDLGNWYYSAIGDEHGYFLLARQMARGQVFNLFSQHGAFDIVPFLSSYLEGKLMQVVGITGIGWKVSIISEVALAIVAFYFLARVLYGYRVAILATGMLATSYYLQAYVHTGYANIETLVPTILALLFCVEGIRRASWLLLFLCGASAGLGWYTYYPSRAAIFIVLVCGVFTVRPGSWFRAGSGILAGFAALFLPLLAVNKKDLINAMLAQSGQGNSTEAVANRALLPVYNTGRSLLAFNYNEHDGPYLHGALAEPLTGLLFVLGLATALATWRDSRSRVLLVWFILGITACGVLSKYDYVSVSRMNYLLPIVALLAAVACDWAIRIVQRRVPVNARPPFALITVVVVLIIVSYNNLHSWYVETPAHTPSSPDAMAIQVIGDPRCMAAPQLPLLVGETLGGEILPALDARGIPNHVVLAPYNKASTWIESLPRRCAIFRSKDDPRARQVMAEIAVRWPTIPPVQVHDISGLTTIAAYYRRVK